MNDKIVNEVETQFTSTGADSVISALSKYERAVSDAGTSGALTGKQVDTLSSYIIKSEAILGKASTSVSKYSQSFSNLRKEVSKATNALRDAAQEYVVKGGTDVLGTAAKTMNLDEAEEIKAIRDAERITSEQVADRVIADNRLKAKSEDDYVRAMSKAAQRLQAIQKARADADAREENRLYNIRMDYRAREEAAEKALQEKIRSARAKSNSEAAKTYQQAYTDPKSFLGQENSREASTGLKAGDTTWARQAKAQQAFRAELARTDVAFQQQRREAELTSLRHAILARNVEESGSAAKRSSEGYVALRYALYDVSRTALVASAAIAGVGVATVKSFADTESGFSALERTSGLYGDALGPLRDELLELSRVLPVATADIQSFAARGAQLGIAQESIAGFTETIAKFVATSPEVDINSVAEAFGRISNLTGTDDFTALASSIALVGVNAAATDQQIIKTTQEFARAAATTSLTADEIIGISAAFAALGVQPEAARGVANQFFTQLNEGAAGLNESMAVAAQMMGMTEQAAASLFKTDTGTFFQNFVTGLSQTEDVTLALNNMGLEGARLGPAFAALAKNTRDSAAGQSVLSQAMADANQGFRERLELDRQFAPIADDVNSKTLLIANAFRELAYEIGLELAPTVGAVLDRVKDLINGVTDFIKTPIGGSVARMVAFLSGLAVVAGGLISVLAGVGASALAVRFALQQISGAGVSVGLEGVRASLQRIGVTATVSATQVSGLNGALNATTASTTGAAAGASSLGNNLGKLAKGGGAVGGVLLVTSALTDMEQTLLDLINIGEWWFNSILSWTSGLKPFAGILFGFAEALGGVNTASVNSAAAAVNLATVFEAIGNAITQSLSGLIQGVQATINAVRIWANSVLQNLGVIGSAFLLTVRPVVQALQTIGNALAQFGAKFGAGFENGIRSVDIASEKMFGALRGMIGSTTEAGSAQDLLNTSLDDFSSDYVPSAVGGMDDYGNSAGQAAQEVRTLVDYANDLAKVWDRAFDIRFSGQTTLDAITSSFISIREAADEAAKRIRDLNNDIASLSSDIKIQEYFLSIAIEYGDTKRAAAIEAELAKKRAELADKTDELQSEQDAANKSLEGNSKGAIENRKTITDLVRQYQAHIGALAASGMSQADLAIATQRLKADFIAQATQLGYNRAELERYAAAFDDVATAIARVPRNITVTASTDPAIQAFNELQAAADRAASSYNGLRGAMSAGLPVVDSYGTRQQALMARIEAQKAYMQSLVRAGNYPGALSVDRLLSQMQADLRNGNFYTGGFTGRGGMYEPAGTVHRGEYVFPKSAVDQSTGLPTQAALLGMLGSLPSRSVAAPSRAASSSGATTVALTAGSIQAIAQAVQPYLVIDGKLVGDATSRAYANDTMAGAY